MRASTGPKPANPVRAGRQPIILGLKYSADKLEALKF
jgi:hypothetical protein